MMETVVSCIFQLQSVRDVGETYTVAVQVVDGRIIVDGLPADVVKACEQINGIIHEAARYRKLRKQETLCGYISYCTVQWCYLEVGTRVYKNYTKRKQI